MKERPILFSAPMVRAILGGTKTQTRRLVKPDYLACLTGDCPHWRQAECDTELAKLCRYGQPGERLWVKETWRARGGLFYFAADFAAEDVAELSWKPSIFMPRGASRITLEVTAVRVERLKAITEADAAAEGVQPKRCITNGVEVPVDPQYRAGFADLWQSINGKRAPWKSNPWVWVVSFKRVEA